MSDSQPIGTVYGTHWRGVEEFELLAITPKQIRLRKPRLRHEYRYHRQINNALAREHNAIGTQDGVTEREYVFASREDAVSYAIARLRARAERALEDAAKYHAQADEMERAR